MNVVVPLAVLASISPLLTFAFLWQTKEWRVDRLREHFRSEGLLRQTFGLVRPIILGLFGFFGFFGLLPSWILLTLIAFTALNIVQFGLKRQPRPVWTHKAIALVITTLVLTTAITLFANAQVIVFVPLLQPMLLGISIALWTPVDNILKRRIMQQATELRSQCPDCTVIGITGSVGKSTTKELLAHLLQNKSVLATPAHVNTEMGVSQWLLRTLPKSQSSTLIVEMGAYRKGEIAKLCEIVQPHMGVITFIGKQHLGLFGSQEALCKAKGELVMSLPQDGHAFLNADSALCSELQKDAPCPVTTISTGGSANREAYDIEETSSGIRFKSGDTLYQIPLHGTHNVTNVLLAISVAEELGMSAAQCSESLKSYEPAQKTFSLRTEHDVTILDDTHNASFESFKAGLAWARSHPAKEKVLLTSGLMELGQSQDRLHGELGAMAAGIVDRVVFLNRNSARAFEKGYGENMVDVFSKKTKSVSSGALLLCIGRMSSRTISALLP